MAVEIREIVLTARVVEPAAPAPEVDRAVEQRALIEACLAEVRRFLERRSER